MRMYQRKTVTVRRKANGGKKVRRVKSGRKRR